MPGVSFITNHRQSRTPLLASLPVTQLYLSARIVGAGNGSFSSPCFSRPWKGTKWPKGNNDKKSNVACTGLCTLAWLSYTRGPHGLFSEPCMPQLCLCSWQSCWKPHGAHLAINQGHFAVPHHRSIFFWECPAPTLTAVSDHLLPQFLRWIFHVTFFLGSLFSLGLQLVMGWAPLCYWLILPLKDHGHNQMPFERCRRSIEVNKTQ